MSLKDVVNREMTNIEAQAANMGIEILEINCSNQRLEFVCDKPGGITLEECAVFSRSLESLLDVQDARISARYDLEVSSPGLYRPLRKPEHYRKAVGERISVEMDKPRAGRRRFTGRLKEFTGENLVLTVEGVEGDTIIKMSEIGKSHLSPTMDWKKTS